MYTIFTTNFAQPGKLPELIALLQELRAWGETTCGIDAAVVRPLTGILSEVDYLWQVESLARYEELIRERDASPEFWDRVAKAAGLVVPGAARTKIYRRV